MLKSFLIFTLIVSVPGSKLNVPRVLLPVSPKAAVNYTLEVSDGGCYTWTSTRPEAVKIVPIFNEEGSCSRSAVVTPSGSLTHKTSAIILAEDKSTGDSLRCDVIVNHIQSLQISMQTHELYIEDAPEEFYARAYDDQGNEFSSLEGLTFKWTVEGYSASEGGANEPVLRWVRYFESSYEGLSSVKSLEDRGLQGHMILLEGLRTGSAKVSVKLEDDYFKNVATVEVQVIVVANLVLDPAEVYILPGGVVPVRLSQFRQGRADIISLPSSQYYLEAEDSAVADIKGETGSIQGLKVGTTNVKLRDRNLKDTAVEHAPSITVHVVYPSKMGLAFLPHRNWATVVGEHHEIQVELFDEEGHAVLPSDSVNVKLNLPNAFQSIETSNNGTYCYGRAIEVGVFKVKASLRFLTLPDGTEVELKPALKAVADLEIFEAIVVVPAVRIFPWDPLTLPKYEQKFKASGGSESYQWSSSNTSVATVSQTGIVKTNSVGSSEIAAYLGKNPHVKGTATVYVLPAVNMSIIRNMVEVEEGSTLIVPIKLETSVPEQGVTDFTNCEKLPLQVEFSDKKNFVEEETKVPMMGGCRSVTVKAVGVSVSKLSVSYSLDDLVMKDSITLASYKPLKPVQPSSGETVMALGSSRSVVFEGGPLPWINKPSGHFRKVSLANETVASIGELEVQGSKSRKDVHVVEVTCRHIGETDVEIKVGNIASSSNPKPAVCKASIKVICTHPAKLHLVPEVRHPDNSRAPCPLDSSTQRVAAQSYLDLNLWVTVRDSKGKKLDVLSSLEFDWNLSESGLATVENQRGVFQDRSERDGYNVLGRTYQILKPSGKTGPLDVTAKIIGYKKEVLESLGLRKQPELHILQTIESEEEVAEDSLSSTVDLILVDDVTIDPGKSSVFNHQNSKLLLNLRQGSGFFNVEFQPRNIARVQYNASNRTVIVTPITNGHLEVIVTDACLWTKSPAVSQVEVVGLSRLEIDVVDKIEQGKSATFQVKAFDTTGKVMEPSSLAHLQLEPVLGSSIVEIRALENMEHSLRGLEIGETSLAFTAGHGEEKIQSPLVNVQVFAPLRINPRNVTLILGAALQVTTTGGPQPDASVEFSLEKSEIASCSPSGLITGSKLGHSQLIGRSVGTDRTSGKQRTYSQDQVDVHIVQLHGVRINLPLTRIRKGSEVPLWVVGLDKHQSPLSFGSSDPPLFFDWSVSDEKNARLVSFHHESGLSSNPDKTHFAARLKALEPGNVLIKVRVHPSQPQSGQLAQNLKELTAEISVHIYESISQVAPYPTNGNEILMMPNTNVRLLTNLDSSAVVSYVAEDLAKDDLSDVRVVRVDGRGTLMSGSSLGQTAVLVNAKNNHGISQSLATLAEVRTVSYMMSTTSPLSAEPSVRSLGVIPRGFQVELKLSYHDILGRRFHAVRNQLAFRPNRFDLTRITVGADNSSLLIKADRSGRTLIHIYDEANSGLQDFVRIDVEDVIIPSNVEFTVGDVICFSSPLLSLNGWTGKWTTTERLVELDSETGVAVAVQQGSGEIINTIAPKQVSSSSFTIAPVSSLLFNKPSERIVTNSKSSVFSFPFVLSSANRKSSTNLVGSNCSSSSLENFLRHHRLPVSCSAAFSVDSEIKLEEVFTVFPEFDISSGYYQCVLKSTGIRNPAASFIDADIIIVAQYSSTVKQSLVVPFQPAVYVQTSELKLTDTITSGSVVITGKTDILKSVQVSVSDSSVLITGSPEFPDTQTLKIPVKLSSFYVDGEAVVHVVLNFPLTKQKVEIPVYLKTAKEGVCPAPSKSWLESIANAFHVYQEWALSLISIAGTAAAIYIGYRALTGPGYQVTSDQKVFVNSSTPIQHDISRSAPVSHRGPYLWSVDHTSSPKSSYPPTPSESPSPNRRLFANQW